MMAGFDIQPVHQSFTCLNKKVTFPGKYKGFVCVWCKCNFILKQYSYHCSISSYLLKSVYL